MAGNLLRRLRTAQAALEGPERYLDLRLDLIDPSGSPLLVAGGLWDKTRKKFEDPSRGDAKRTVAIGIQESQVEFAAWYATWLSDFRDGRRGTKTREVSVAALSGDRRGGKTWIGTAAIAAACIDVPIAPECKTPLIAWIVSKSNHQRHEVEQWLVNTLPPYFYHHRQAPEHSFSFVHGPLLQLLSAEDPDSLKRGRCDIALINEPQLVMPRAVANVVLGASDLGGLVIFAANPPSGSNSRGEWLFDLKEVIDDESVAMAKGSKAEPIGVKFFHLSSNKNAAIDQIARRRAGKIAAIVDPSLKAGDVEGSWRRPVERALWEFDKHRHLHAVPDFGLVDVTREVASERGEYGDWSYVAGVDFDWKPHIVAVVYRIFGSLENPLFWAIDEFAGEKQWTTAQWIEAFGDWGSIKGYTQSSTLFIGDASSSWGGNRNDPKVEQGHTSFETIETEGWTILPPQDHRGKTGKARNPNVDMRLDLYNELLRKDRHRIDPVRCPWLTQCAREATTEKKTGRRKLKHDQFAHSIDASSYPLWRLASRGNDLLPKGPPMITIPVRRFGDDF